jgi:hypothetical protein
MKKCLALISFLFNGFVSTSYAADTAITNGNIILQNTVTYLFNPLYQLVTGIAIVYFLFGVAKFIYDLNDPEKKLVGKSHLLWGMVGLFIILSIGGILPGINSLIGGMFSY